MARYIENPDAADLLAAYGDCVRRYVEGPDDDTDEPPPPAELGGGVLRVLTRAELEARNARVMRAEREAEEPMPWDREVPAPRLR